MSDKELLYIEDALNQLQIFKTKCANYSNQMQDRELKAYLKDVEERCQTMFNHLYKVLQ
jgi:Mg2+ and Co2+ transporter CorA